MNVATDVRSLVIVGLPPRLALERATDPRRAADSLTASFNGQSTVVPSARELSTQNFGGLPIAERQLVDALSAHGTYDNYCVLINDAARKRLVEEEIRASSRDERIV